MDLDKISETVARIQFIADVSLVAHCEENELKMALSMVSDMARTIDTSSLEDLIFYPAKQ